MVFAISFLFLYLHIRFHDQRCPPGCAFRCQRPCSFPSSISWSFGHHIDDLQSGSDDAEESSGTFEPAPSEIVKDIKVASQKWNLAAYIDVDELKHSILKASTGILQFLATQSDSTL